jgi:hypothetical protein
MTLLIIDKSMPRSIYFILYIYIYIYFYAPTITLLIIDKSMPRSIYFIFFVMFLLITNQIYKINCYYDTINL